MEHRDIPLQAVDRVKHPFTLQQFTEEYVNRRRPVVIRTRSLADLGWHTDRWTEDYLVEKAGQTRVIVQFKSGDWFGTRETGQDKIRMPFEQFVRVVMKNEKGHKTWYLNIQTLQRVLDPPLLQLQGDFNVPEYFDGHAVRWISLWMGHNPGAYNRSQLHNDNHDNLYAVIRGRKHFTIFAPQDGHNLYTRGRIREILDDGRVMYEETGDQFLPQFSRVDVENIDLEQFPLAADATPHEADLEENDMLFLPAGWYHDVRSYGKNIAMNFWADPPGSERPQHA
ncbi:MAG: cupin-like domain-containing protein [Gammaproteobacteria bacterium]